MRRVVVIGSAGAGKSTFAARLGRATGPPVIHLDALYWKPGWVPTPRAEWDAKLAPLAAGPAWIMGRQLRPHDRPASG
jgi:adenylate kinase family enzyme